MKKIIAILLICSAALYAAPPFALETIVPKKYRLSMDSTILTVNITDYLQLQRNFTLVQRKLREMDAFRDSTLIQHDTTRTPASGIDTVYLPIKYESKNFAVMLTPIQDILTFGQGLTDSTFVAITYDAFASPAGSRKYHWCTIGIRKK